MPNAVAHRFHPPSNEDLVAGLEAGDNQAYEDLYRQYGRMVHAIARSRLGCSSLADDATQETMLRTWRAAARLDPDRPIAPWLTTVARRVAIDIHRREAGRRTTPLDEVRLAASVSDDHARIDTATAVRTALRQLPAGDAELACLHHLNGLTYTEVAAHTATPVGTVKSRSFRVHRELRRLLERTTAEQ